MLSNQVTCDSTLRQIVYFRGAPDGAAFAGVWRQLAEDEYILKHRIALPPATIGIHRIDVPDPLPVERGDFLGIHYPRDGGDDAGPSGGVVVHSVPADGVVDVDDFYQTLVVNAADDDFPTDRTVRLSSFESRLESRTFALQAVLVPESLGQSSIFTQRFIQLEVLREHRPPPNASTIELLNDFCRASVLCVDNVAVLPGSGS